MSCKGCQERENFMKSFEEGVPYIQKQISDTQFIRYFGEDINQNWLKWHWDEEPRIIEANPNTDWKFQFDDELPISFNGEIFIEPGRYHRIIKGTDSVTLKITKL